MSWSGKGWAQVMGSHEPPEGNDPDEAMPNGCSALGPDELVRLSPRDELGAFIGTQPGRLGEIYNRADMTPAAIAADLEVSTPNFVSNYRQQIAAALDGFVPSSASTLRATISSLSGLARRGEGVLSADAMRLLTSNLDGVIAAQADFAPTEPPDTAEPAPPPSPRPRRVADDQADTARLNPTLLELAEALVAESRGAVERVLDDARTWLDLEETASTMAFAEARGDELQIVPFVGAAIEVQDRQYVIELRPAWLDGEHELVVDARAVTTAEDRDAVLDHLRAARDYWAGTIQSAPAGPLPEAELPSTTTGPDLSEVDFTAADSSEAAEDAPGPEVPSVEAQLRADVSEQWSWASAAARIPQIADLSVDVSEPVARARITVAVHDADLKYGERVAYEGPLPAPDEVPRSIHVSLSPRVMSRVEERRNAECIVTLEDAHTGRVMGTVVQAIDIQPRDLWNFDGDSRHSGLVSKLRTRLQQIDMVLGAEPNHPDRAELEQCAAMVQRELRAIQTLSNSLLASFVRPNHPEVAILAREAATIRGTQAGDAAFSAFQLDEDDSTERATVGTTVDASIDAIYESVRRRQIAYSEPPPGWDYTTEGQRIRDHGEMWPGVDLAPAWTPQCLWRP